MPCFVQHKTDSQNKKCIVMVQNFRTNKENLELLFNKYIDQNNVDLEIPKVILDLCILFFGFGHNKLDNIQDRFDFKSAMKQYRKSQAYAFDPNALKIDESGSIIQWNPFQMFPMNLKLSTMKLAVRMSGIYRKLFRIKILSYDTSLCKPVNISVGFSGRKYKIDTLLDAYSSIVTVGDIISILYMNKTLYFGINDIMHKQLKVTEFTPLEIVIFDKMSLQLL